MDRYDQWHTYNGINFYLSEYIPDIEECRVLILKVVEQAIRDYITLADQIPKGKRELWETARDFIFDDDYFIFWGDKELNLEELLQNVDLEIEYLRRSATQQFKEYNNGT